MGLDRKEKRLKIFKDVLSLFLILFIVGVVGIIISFLTKKSPCLIYSFTGFPCPSCGMSRAVFSFFTGSIKASFFYHPLFFLLPFLPFLGIVKNYSEKVFNIIIVILIILFILLWIVRMYLYFPSIAPMNFNSEAVLPRIFKFGF